MEALDKLKAAGEDVATRWIGMQGAVAIRNRLILEAYQAGESQADIAAAAHLTPQRINQLVYDSEPEDENGTH